MPHAPQNLIVRKKYPPVKTEIRSHKGKEYKYYIIRITTDVFENGVHKQIKFTGTTKREVQEKYDVYMGTIAAPQLPSFVNSPVMTDSHGVCSQTLEEWMHKWLSVYCKSLKNRTLNSYKSNCEKHIIPVLGSSYIDDLTPEMVQEFYNGLSNVNNGAPLSPKTVKNIHGTLHRALDRAVRLGYISSNPADCRFVELPRIYQKEIIPFEEDDLKAFFNVIKDNPYKNIYLLCLFLGLREGEALGLSWTSINFVKKTVTIKQQLQKNRETKTYELTPTKNGKIRTLCMPDFIAVLLQEIKEDQNTKKRIAGKSWQNSFNLVFTNELGRYIIPQTVYCNFKRRVKEIGCSEKRVHDLRHTFAVLSLQNGDDIKTVQNNLGHSTAAFTLAVYAHATDEMKKQSAARMSARANSLYFPMTSVSSQ